MKTNSNLSRGRSPARENKSLKKVLQHRAPTQMTTEGKKEKCPEGELMKMHTINFLISLSPSLCLHSNKKNEINSFWCLLKRTHTKTFVKLKERFVSFWPLFTWCCSFGSGFLS
jgi:hypothetical protein